MKLVKNGSAVGKKMNGRVVPKHPGALVKAYWKQNGHMSLTPRQMRRFWKKTGKWAARNGGKRG